jgi:hypothetical protein
LFVNFPRQNKPSWVCCHPLLPIVAACDDLRLQVWTSPEHSPNAQAAVAATTVALTTPEEVAETAETTPTTAAAVVETPMAVDKVLPPAASEGEAAAATEE